ncbi:MAG TPA: hypothetical protein VI893_06295 [Thermoplasmata archaeon]|nr:hypothetical protein [Thermoplasmata archaeon]
MRMMNALCASVLMLGLAVSAVVPVGVSAASSVEEVGRMSSLEVTPAEGPIFTPVTVEGWGFDPGAKVQILWWTVEGNRVSGSGFEAVSWEWATVTPLGSGDLVVNLKVPSDLGGPAHRIEAVVDGVSIAETSFTITRTHSISPVSGPEGTVITIDITGGGWTQFDNNVAITYDNAFLGFACSFNSQGNMSIYIQATGAAGDHVVGIYPALYYGPSDAATPWKHAALVPSELPTPFEIKTFVFTITESDSPGKSVVKGATSVAPVAAPDSLVIAQQPAVPIEDGTPRLSVGNGAQGIVGGSLPYALAGFAPGAKVELRWNSFTSKISITGALKDKFGGWVLTPTYRTLGTVTVGNDGKAIGALTIPQEYGDDHLLDAVVDGNPVANTTFKVITQITGELSADGSAVVLKATGLGTDKYTAVYNVMYDNKLFGWIGGALNLGSASVTIPVVGTEGKHAIDVYEGSNAWPYLNMPQSPWPWVRAYRFSMVIPSSTTPTDPSSSVAAIPLYAGLILLVVIAGLAFAFGGILTSRRRRKKINGIRRNGTKRSVEEG